MLNTGDILLVCNRRLFANDENRFFLGKVDAYDAGIVKLTGHSFLRDAVSGHLTEKTGQASKIFSIASGSVIVYQLPSTLQLDKLRFEHHMLKLALVDDQGFSLDLTEKIYRQS